MSPTGLSLRTKLPFKPMRIMPVSAAANPTKKRFRSGSPSSSQFARNAVKNGAIEMMTPTLDANV